jgi:hypothetical protein
MSIFKRAENQTAYLKAGFQGFQGTGKTYTALSLALGLHQMCKSDKPIMFIDTETGSDWAIPRCNQLGIELHVAKTRAFKDLISGTREAEQNAFCLIADSVSHFWEELVTAYKHKKNIKGRIQFQHWADIKEEWKEFSTLFVNSNLHFIVCGRAGWQYDYQDSDDKPGKKELIKSGTKMKAEGEFGFEPSLSVEMERLRGAEIGDKIIHIAHILKDRRMDDKTLDGMVIKNPTFEDFLPHIECLNIGGEHIGVDASRNSQDMFDEGGESYTETRRKKDTAIEEFNGMLELYYPGTSKDCKHAKLALKKYYYGTYSDTEIGRLPVEKLQGAQVFLGELFNSEAWADEVGDIIADLMAAKEAKEQQESGDDIQM